MIRNNGIEHPAAVAQERINKEDERAKRKLDSEEKEQRKKQKSEQKLASPHFTDFKKANEGLCTRCFMFYTFWSNHFGSGGTTYDEWRTIANKFLNTGEKESKLTPKDAKYTAHKINEEISCKRKGESTYNSFTLTLFLESPKEKPQKQSIDLTSSGEIEKKEAELEALKRQKEIIDLQVKPIALVVACTVVESSLDPKLVISMIAKELDIGIEFD
jgi:hypothetical protein